MQAYQKTWVMTITRRRDDSQDEIGHCEVAIGRDLTWSEVLESAKLGAGVAD
jgi:hypothetical protein